MSELTLLTFSRVCSMINIRYSRQRRLHRIHNDPLDPLIRFQLPHRTSRPFKITPRHVRLTQQLSLITKISTIITRITKQLLVYAVPVPADELVARAALRQTGSGRGRAVLEGDVVQAEGAGVDVGADGVEADFEVGQGLEGYFGVEPLFGKASWKIILNVIK